MLYKKPSGKNGFTIVELLIVIGIISIIAASVIMIISPAQKLLDARGATREAHMSAIGKSFHLAVVRDNGFPDIETILNNSDCWSGENPGVTEYRDFIDTCALLIGLGEEAPLDPQGGRYRVRLTANGQVSVTLPETVTESAMERIY